MIPQQTKERISKEAKALYPNNQSLLSNDTFESRLADAQQQSHITAAEREAELAQPLVEALQGMVNY